MTANTTIPAALQPTLADADKARLPLHDVWFSGDGGATYSWHSDYAFMWIFWIAVGWFVVLFALTVYFCVKYRRRPDRTSVPSPAHNSTLEVTWTVIPSLFLVWMFIVGFKGYGEMVVPKGGGLELDLVAQKWAWSLTYPNGATTGERTDPTSAAANPEPNAGHARAFSQPIPIFYVPEATPVQLKMRSQDVMHSFWVPDFRTKIDVMPNRYTKYWFQTEKLPDNAKTLRYDASSPNAYLNGVRYADHWVFCAEYCGEQHSEMAAVIRVVPKDSYDRWVEKNGTPDDPVAYGRKLWEQNCRTCHSVDGSKNIGPTWKDLYGASRAFTDGSSAVADDEYIRSSILNPASRIVSGYPNQMNSFAGLLDEAKINALIAYMKSLSTQGGGGGAGTVGGAAERPADQK